MFCVLDNLTCVLMYSIIFSLYFFIFRNQIKIWTPHFLPSWLWLIKREEENMRFFSTPTKQQRKMGRTWGFFLLPQSNKEKWGEHEVFFFSHKATKKNGENVRFFSTLPKKIRKSVSTWEVLLPQSNKEKGGAHEVFSTPTD